MTKRPRCPLIAFNELVGGKYKLRILWVLSKEATRYGGLNRSLVVACHGRPVTPRTLSRELRDLAGRGLIWRTAYPEVPPRVEYGLTDLGRTLVPLIDQIVAWGAEGRHTAILDAAETLDKV
ncbi:MAG: transcriptional regulator [Phenylobacterium sp.]|nr:transcriptional regulator [Phenylobacterium sp.]